MTALPHALDDFASVERALAGRPFAAFLDYDGTLSPIAARPELARLSDATRAAVARLAAAVPTAILSGRGRADVAALVGLPGLWYAGSHGFDIAGPGGERFEPDPSLRPLIAAAGAALHDELGRVPGTLVEVKDYAVSVHFRLAADGDVPAMEAAADRIVAGEPRLRKAHGKKVFEVRPAMDWDKGRAVGWLLDRILPGGTPIVVGDDATDEDAFRAASGGVAVLVAEADRPTAASYWLRDPDEVRAFLDRLSDLARR